MTADPNGPIATSEQRAAALELVLRRKGSCPRL